MYCERLNVPAGTAIICRGGQRPKPCACGKPTTKLCDWTGGQRRAGRGRLKRCSVGMCDEHTYSPAKDKDLCPEHAAVWKAYLYRKAKA